MNPRVVEACHSADYASLLQRFKGLFREKRKCVVAASSDAIASAFLLARTLGWEVVGYFTSAQLEIAEDLGFDAGRHRSAMDALRFSDLVMVGAYIHSPGIPSISASVVRWSLGLPAPERGAMSHAFNPNALAGVTAACIKRRLPFGASHFLLCCLCNWWQSLERLLTPGLLSLLLSVEDSFQKLISPTERVRQWVGWLAANPIVPETVPFIRASEHLTLPEMLKMKSEFSALFRSLGIRLSGQRPCRTPAALPSTPIRRLEQLTQTQGAFAPVLDARTVRWPLITRVADSTRRDFEHMLGLSPFTYTIRWRGTRGLVYAERAGLRAAC
jgi:hypothetical protein